MGACASRFNVLKNADDVPAPAPAEEVASREVTVAEEVAKKDDGAAAEEDDEAKRQSLGNLLTEKGSAEEIKQAEVEKSNENIKSVEPVADKTEKALPIEDVKPASSVETEPSLKKTEEKPVAEVEKLDKIEDKPVEAIKIDKKEEDKKVEKPEEKKVDEKPVEATKVENKPVDKKDEAQKTEEKKPVLDAEKAKAGEDKTKK